MGISQQRLPRVLIACALVAALMLGAPTARAGGVVGNGTLASCTESAFDAALVGGGSVTFNCGPGPHTILITSQKSINDNTTIDGGGKITLDGQNAHRLFDVGAVLTLRNIVLARGYFNGDGGAIRNNSNGSLILENSTIRDSRATLSGGAILSTGPLTITNSLLQGNTALNGGALYPRFAGAQTMIVNSVLRDNHATDTTNGWGGALLAWDGAPVTIEGSDLYNNTARRGGGIYHFGNSVLTLRNFTWVHDNQAVSSGGGIHNYSGTALLTNVTLSRNIVWAVDGPFDGIGGGLYNDENGTATLSIVTLSGNMADTGGGLDNRGTATLTNGTFSGNSAGRQGGGLYNLSNGTATLTNVTFSGNMADNGGGIYNSGGTALLTNVTFNGNTADFSGGGLYNYLFGTATLTNVTFSGNSADDTGGGLFSIGTTTLTNVTLSGNSAGAGGGIYRSITAPAVKHTIVANSPSGGNCAGGVVNNIGFNLSNDISCGITFVPDVMLGPLADNGGPTQTHMLLPGSPAINFVATGCPPPATDQRGAPRNVGACDAGAVEYGALLPSVYLPLVVK